jgi:hypothetical protein
MRTARDSNPNRQIRSLVLGVDLVGSGRIWPAHSDGKASELGAAAEVAAAARHLIHRLLPEHR